MPDVDVRIFTSEFNALLKGANGPVYRLMIRSAEAVRQEAKRLVGVHQPVPGERRARRPGTLRDSIVKRPARTSDGDIVFYVGSNDPIAKIHHDGTLPHTIRATRAPALRFYWAKAGRVVSFKSVHHPGTPPRPYLKNALRVLNRLP
jgi:hypothetical protein